MLFAIHVFDAYTIARVIKSYSFYDSSIIIIYAGDKHIQNYLSTFEYLHKSNVLNITNRYMIGEKIEIDNLDSEISGGCIELDKYKTVWDTIIDDLKNINVKSKVCDKTSWDT